MARQTLTDVGVKRLRPPTRGQVEHWDAVLPGLAVRVTEHGKKSWILMTRLRGRLLRYTIGSYPAIRLAKARELARSALHLVAEGTDPRDERKRRTPSPETFAAVAEAFLAGDRRAGPDWAPKRAKIVRGTLVRAWGERPIASITRRDVIALLDTIVARGTPIQANRTHAVIARLFRWAVNQDLAPGSPCVGLEKPAPERRRERVLSDTELAAIWTAAGTRSLIWETYLKTLILTAQREGEVAHMAWAHLDLNTALWTIPRAKGGHAHEVPLAPAVVALLGALPRIDASAYVFTTRAGRPVSGFGKVKADVTLAAGVQGWRLHDFRRTAATGLARSGTPKDTIRRVLGHAEGDVTATYVRHGWLDEKRAALEQWVDYVQRLVANLTEHQGAA